MDGTPASREGSQHGLLNRAFQVRVLGEALAFLSSLVVG